MNEHIIEIVAGLILILAIIWAYTFLKKYKKEDSSNNYLLEFLPNMFPTLGMLGTFGGITYGLWFFNPDDLENSIPHLLQGLKTAFLISIFGVILLLYYSFRSGNIRFKKEKDLKSDETLALYELIKLNKESNEKIISSIDILNSSISSRLDQLDQSVNQINYIEFNGNPVHIGNILTSLYDETKQQTSSLQNFSTDLATAIQKGITQINESTSNSFDRLINDTKVTEKLDSVRTEITDLGTKLQSPAEDVVKGLSENLATSMQEILQEVKGSIGEGINSDMAEVVKQLTTVSTNLNDFPNKINSMAAGLETTFKKLEEGLAKTSTQTNVKSKEAVDSIAGQMQLLEGTLKSLAENITNTTNTSTENVRNQFSTISDTITAHSQSQEQTILQTTALVEKLSDNINTLNTLSTNFGNVITNINTANDTLKLTSTQFQSVSSKVEETATTLSNTQNQLINYNNTFINNNIELLTQYNESLEISSNFNQNLVEKYNTIHNSFGNVFTSVNEGITRYSSSMKESLEDFLTTYNTSLTKGTRSLENAVSGLSESIENLSDVLPQKK